MQRPDKLWAVEVKNAQGNRPSGIGNYWIIAHSAASAAKKVKRVMPNGFEVRSIISHGTIDVF